MAALTDEQTLYSDESPANAPKPKTRLLPIALVLVVVLAAVATGYLLFIKNIQSTFVARRNPEAETAWIEYQNQNGFALSYPQAVALTEAENGVILAGENGLSFVAGELDGRSLREVVVELANNFGLEVTDIPETFTVDSRVGYKIASDNATYYYFPLFNDKYLEIVDKKELQTAEEIVTKVKFVAPQSASVN